MAYVTFDRNNKVQQGIRGPAEIFYNAAVIATGGRSGQAQSSDRNLAVNLSIPKEMGGNNATGTNPEQLFAAAFASSFEDTLSSVAKRQNVDLNEAFIQARIGLGPIDKGVNGLSVALHIYLPGVEKSTAEKLVAQAVAICPYASAIRGNIPVHFVIEDQAPLFQA